MLKKHFNKYGGILIGALYGLVMRVLFEFDFGGLGIEVADLFSITFVIIVPLVVGTTPLLFSSKEHLASATHRIFSPVLAVLTFFIFCYVSHLEDLICIVIISIPFLVMAGISGAIIGTLILHFKTKKENLYSIFFLPLLTGLVEPNFPAQKENYETSSSILINASAAEIWKNIVRVDKIEDKDYKKGFLNYAGIPRPLYAELNKDTAGGLRIGHFEGGLQFREHIVEWNKNTSITFDIHIIPSTTTQSIFERHMLNGEHFHFLTATYELKEITANQTELVLTTSYQLNTTINFYGELWGYYLLKDFQNRLIEVIKKRCEV